MDESEIALAVRPPVGSRSSVDAEQTRIPSGLFNLGQTCYLNSSLQVMRMMPQIQTALNA